MPATGPEDGPATAEKLPLTLWGMTVVGEIREGLKADAGLISGAEEKGSVKVRALLPAVDGLALSAYCRCCCCCCCPSGLNGAETLLGECGSI